MFAEGSFRSIGLATLLTLAVGLIFAMEAEPSAAESEVTPAEAASIGQDGYVYGYPLLEFLRVRSTMTSVRCPDRKGNAPINSLSNTRRFATPRTRTVVAPNVDTYYSIAQLDLARGPVVITHPNMGKRYFVFQLLDPYTNNVAYIGSRTTGSKAGRFAITWKGGKSHPTRGAKKIKVDSRRIWVIGRTLVKGRKDRKRARKVMSKFRLIPPNGERRFGQRCKPGKTQKAITPDGREFLDRLDVALKRNPPPARDAEILARLASVGVGPQAEFGPDELDQATYEALIAGVNQTAALLPEIARSTVISRASNNSGWAFPPDNTGNYGTDYVSRAGVAILGLGAGTPEESVYPTGYNDSDGQLLYGTNNYRIVFRPSDLPPVKSFWSLTAYDIDGNLSPNKIHRYAIGSSHGGMVKRRNGNIVIRVQHKRPDERKVNWLPVPSGQFRLNLRLYVPRQKILSGAWQPPQITRIESE